VTAYTRRSLLRRAAALGAWTAAAAGGGTTLSLLDDVLRPVAASAQLPTPFAVRLPIPPVLTAPDITLVAAPAEVQVLPGATTRMWTFNGTFPGPTIRRPAGEPTRVTVQHRLPAEADTLTIHHHGAHSAPEHDGGPLEELAIPVGGERTYLYEGVEDGVPERAALQWYHDHSHHRTSLNAYMGLAGLFIYDDEVEARLPLPRGRYEIPLFLTDRTFDEDNQLDLSQYASPASVREVRGMTHLVNGVAEPFVDAEPRRYRLRVHNGAHFALYNLKLAVSSSADVAQATAAPAVPLLQIGTEAGLLPRSVVRQQVLLGPAERADLVVDLAPYRGQTLVLAVVAPRDTSRSAAGLPAQPLPLGDPVRGTVLMQVRVGTTVTEPDPGPLPEALRPLPDWAADLPGEPSRVFVFGRGVDPAEPGQTPHTINGRPFDHRRVDATPELGSVESWLLLNASQQTHYIHLHDVDWVVVSRNGSPPAPHEAGLKETFKIDPGEYVVVGTKFTDHLGAYMVHCHMLDHEDSGMMTRFDVVPAGAGAPTTLTAAEQVRADRLLAAARRSPGRPIPADLVAALDRTVVVDDGGSPYVCDLGA
jgi:spore coat protein A, manganese oxidase